MEKFSSGELHWVNRGRWLVNRLPFFHGLFAATGACRLGRMLPSAALGVPIPFCCFLPMIANKKGGT